MHSKGVLNWNYKNNLSIEVPKNGFQRWNNPKSHKCKNKHPPKKLPEWFGPRTIDPICFHKYGVINQRKLTFKKKCSRTQLVVNKYTLIYALKHMSRNLYITQIHHNCFDLDENTIMHFDLGKITILHAKTQDIMQYSCGHCYLYEHIIMHWQTNEKNPLSRSVPLTVTLKNICQKIRKHMRNFYESLRSIKNTWQEVISKHSALLNLLSYMFTTPTLQNRRVAGISRNSRYRISPNRKALLSHSKTEGRVFLDFPFPSWIVGMLFGYIVPVPLMCLYFNCSNLA